MWYNNLPITSLLLFLFLGTVPALQYELTEGQISTALRQFRSQQFHVYFCAKLILFKREQLVVNLRFKRDFFLGNITEQGSITIVNGFHDA